LQVEIVLPGEFGRLHAVGTTYRQQLGRAHHYPITPRRWWWNGHLPGLGATVALARTMNMCQPWPKR
jgi:hypothetical protein